MVERWELCPHSSMPPVAGSFSSDLQLPLTTGGSAPDPRYSRNMEHSNGD